jgi:hypothetical protein
MLAGLGEDPVDGMGWLRLAQERILRAAPAHDTAFALMKGLDAAPFDRGLWPLRTFQLLLFSAALTPEELAAVQSNIRTMWHQDPKISAEMVKLASRFGVVAGVATALGNDSEAQAALVAMINVKPTATR